MEDNMKELDRQIDDALYDLEGKIYELERLIDDFVGTRAYLVENEYEGEEYYADDVEYYERLLEKLKDFLRER